MNRDPNAYRYKWSNGIKNSQLFSCFPMGISVSYVMFLLCMNSLVLVILQYSALSGGTEKLQHIYCTLAWYHVSLLCCFIADACHFFSSGKRALIFLIFKLLQKLE